MKYYLGLDVHCKKTVYVLQNDDGKVLGEGSIPTTVEGLSQMVKELKLPKDTPIGLETGAQANWVAQQLEAMSMQPFVINAKEVRQKARRLGQKTDRRDAFEICDGLRREIYISIVWVPGEGIERLRKILSRRRHFVRIATRQITAVKFLLRSAGISYTRLLLNRQAGWCRLFGRAEVAPLREHLEMHEAMWRLARENVQKLEKELIEALQPFAETMNLLITVPGVALITAATYIATLGTPHRFPTSGHAVSYVGLVPSNYDSGEREIHGHITKQGSPDLRAALCESAHHAHRATHPLNPYYNRIAAKQGYKRAIVAVSHRLARILYQMWKKNEAFDVRKLNVVRQPKTLSKTVYYQIRKEPPKALAS